MLLWVKICASKQPGQAKVVVLVISYIYLRIFFLCIVELCKSNNKLIEVGRLVENFHTLNVLDMVDENITKIKY